MSSEKEKSKKKPGLLIVDDEPSTLAAMERLFREDFKIFKASSGRECEPILLNEEIAIILADYFMPQGNGVQLLRRCRDISPDTVRAIFSGQIDLEDLSKAINEGLIHRFFVKPWDNYVLKLQMLECLQLHQTLKDKSSLERQATTDPITGLSNHRYFQYNFQRELIRAKRHKRHLSLIMIDVDNFKQYNDEFGHPEGDKALLAVGQKLLSMVRNIDTVSRYGGEEFVIVLPDTELKDAAEVAERIRQSFQNVFANYGRGPLTISLGIASYPEHGDKAQTLIEKADAALYQAKNKGRNQSVVAPLS